MLRCCLPTLILLAACLGAGSAAGADDVPTALVVIDIQEFYFPGGAVPLVGPEAASANAGRLLAHFRAAGLPVFHVGHNAAAGRDFHADVRPAAGEEVFYKNEVNAFQDTDLLDRLQQKGILRVVLCGMQTHMCLEGAARAAHDYGLEVVVVADACATRDLRYGDALVPAAAVHAATLATLDRVYGRVLDTDSILAEF
ncbi:MAG: cysteine hydrolase [Krumholzibacteria bacterium]|nr:cysteine hydrolase [Candidatus Krumholzibacteria bacterium]